MLQLINKTPFAATMTMFPNEDAIDTLYVIVKASFDIGQQFTLADEQPPPVEADVYWTEPGKSSIKYASDMHIGKPATDILMIGHACAPGQKEVTQLEVGLQVGQVGKTVCVFGERVWKAGRMTAPTPFKTMAMVYEKAYGGVHMVDGEIDASEERNPLGRGFAGKREVDEMDGVPLPNIEDPAQLIREPNDTPPPAGFGVCAPSWIPRVEYAGTYDETWRKTRAPYLPEDFDKRFLNTAHPDLIYPGYLQGGETVRITNMHPRGTLEFAVPTVGLVTQINMAGEKLNPEFQLETLLLEPNQLKLSMVWRAAVACDKKYLKISEVEINTTH